MTNSISLIDMGYSEFPFLLVLVLVICVFQEMELTSFTQVAVFVGIKGLFFFQCL